MPGEPFWSTSALRPQMWAISEAEDPPGATSGRPARIWNTLRVQGRGDEGLAAIAAAQHGVVHRSQLYAVGIGPGAIAHRVAVGSLHRVLPSVLAGNYPVQDACAAATAALLYAGEDCVLSNSTAAALWGFGPAGEVIEVTVAGRKVRQRPGLRVYRTRMFDLRDVRICNGLPVTAPARTLLDVAGTERHEGLDHALAQARARRLVTDEALAAAIDRAPLRRGARRLRAMLRSEIGSAMTRSRAERRLLALVAQAGLPRPVANTVVCGYEVDLLWPVHRLVVEFDGFAFHSDHPAFERDRLRDQVLQAAGYRVIRVTWRQLEQEPMAVAVRIGQILARTEPTG
jgi:very-short-patch-repair endonuclease